MSVAVLLGTAPGCATPGPQPFVTVSDGRYVMGTVLEITLVVRDAREGQRLLEDAFRTAERLDALLSRRSRASEVSALANAAGGAAVPVSPEVARALRAARDLGAATGGAFDVTIGPLVRLWSDAAGRGRVPDASELASARTHVGFDALHVGGGDPATARLARTGMSLDLGGIGKGFALDELRAQLAGRVDGALLDFGRSSILALGRPAEGDAWRLLVGGGPGEPRGALVLDERALSVSSSLGQYSVIEGVRYGHVIDPRTGRALETGRFAAVLAPRAADAEAWSTALLVLPQAEAAERLAQRPEITARLFGPDGPLLRSGPRGRLELRAPHPGGAPTHPQ